MASAEFYSKLKALHDFINKKEIERQKLEKQFDLHLHSDKRLSAVRANKLKAYWQKINENEKKSQARNEDILRHLERVESCISTLSARTDRLRLVKEQCERKVDIMYPRWREKLQAKIRNKQQLSELNAKRNASQDQRPYLTGPNGPEPNGPGPNGPVLNGPGPNGPVLNGPGPNGPVLNGYHIEQGTTYKRQNTYEGYEGSISSTFDYTKSMDNSYPLDRSESRNSPDRSHLQDNRPQSQELRMKKFRETRSQNLELLPAERNKQHLYHQPQREGGDNYEIPVRQMHRYPSIDSQTKMPVLGVQQQWQVGEVTARTESFSSSDEEEGGKYEVPMRDTPHVGVSLGDLPHIGDTPHIGDSPQLGYTPHIGDSRGESRPVDRQEKPQQSKNQQDIQPQHEQRAQQQPGSKDADDCLQKPLEGAESSPEVKGGSVQQQSRSEGFIVEAVSQNNNEDKETEDSEADSSDEFGSEASLPLSGNEKLSEQKSGSTVTSPPLSIPGFWHLVKTLEMSIETRKGSTQELYNQGARCGVALKMDIVNKANTKAPIFTFDLCTMGVLITEALPELVAGLPKGHLLSDQVLKSGKPVHELNVRSLIATTALAFWDQLLAHMVFLIKTAEFISSDVAQIFAPLIINQTSGLKQRAVEVLTQLLEDAVEEPTLDESSFTQTSPEQTPAPPRQVPQERQEKPVPTLDLDKVAQSDDYSDEESDTERSRQRTPDHKLKETNAYRQLLQSAQSCAEDDEESELDISHKGTSHGHDESSDDEIERAARITPDSARSSGARQKRNVLSSLSGSGALSQHDEEDRKETKEDQIQSRKSVTPATENPKSERSDLSSPSPVPMEAGYVPSAMDHSLKSSGRKSDTLQRSAAFWGDSDDDEESEISVPMGTGKSVQEEKDDFDFYD